MKCDNCGKATSYVYNNLILYSFELVVDEKLCRHCYIAMRQALKYEREEQERNKDGQHSSDLGHNPYQE